MKNLLFLLFLCLAWSGSGQDNDPIRCATMEKREKAVAKDPALRVRMDQLEEKIRRMTTLTPPGEGRMTFTIPVVFHIIHDGDAEGSGENVSTAQILAQLSQINDDFRRTNSDAGNTPQEFQAVAADTGIDFCLARADPQGNPSSGIDRVDVSTLNEVSSNDCWDIDYIDLRIKPQTTWDSDRYLNIWVVEEIFAGGCSGDVLGYATFPGGAPEEDGVVLIYYSIGSLSSPFPGLPSGYDRGRTATHEIGHWLNLYHIWGACGSTNCGCSIDDLVADTPDQREAYFGCPSYPQVSCNSNDMFMNYMDYSFDLCFNLFTQGQAGRMQAAIQAARPNLDASLCQSGTCPPTLTLTPEDPGTLTGNAVFAAELTIEATNTIASGANISYQAGQSITLQPGFTVEAGAAFRAFIAPCNSARSVENAETIRQMVEYPLARQRTAVTNFRIYPNPGKPDRLTLQLEVGSADVFSAWLYNPAGQPVATVLKEQVLENGTHVLPVSALNMPPGIYFLKLVGRHTAPSTKRVMITQ